MAYVKILKHGDDAVAIAESDFSGSSIAFTFEQLADKLDYVADNLPDKLDNAREELIVAALVLRALLYDQGVNIDGVIFDDGELKAEEKD